MIRSVPIFATALPIKKCSVFKHLDLVYLLSQNPLIGLQVKMAVRIRAIAQATTIAVTMFAANMKRRTEKIRRYSERMDSLIDAIATP